MLSAGDKLVCYLTKLGRWFGLLEVLEGPFVDRTPIFYEEDDPFVVRFRVQPLVVLEVDQSVPIREGDVWNELSFTREHESGSTTWTGRVRSSLVRMDDADGELLERILRRQQANGRDYPFDDEEYRELTTLRVRRADKDVLVSVPGDETNAVGVEPSHPPTRESHQVQTTLADVGARMGMGIWIPRADRAAVSGSAQFEEGQLLERLPLNYDDTTLRTIENIDVLWLRGRSIVRAFEVEHTTAVYSGILRMADLLALQPNMNILLHIVAPLDRRSKVFDEIRRPVFSLLERGPLSGTCTFLSYDSVRELADLPNLAHMKDSVVDEYAEEPE